MGGDGSIGGRLIRTVMPSVVRERFVYKLGVLLLVVVVVLALVGTVGYAFARQSVEGNTNKQMETSAELQRDSVGDWTREMNRQTIAMATDDVLADGGPEEIESHLTDKSNSRAPTVRAVHVINRETGEHIAADSSGYRRIGDKTSLEEIDQPWADGSKYQDMRESVDQVDMSDTSFEDPDDGHSVYFATPVLDNKERVVVVIGSISAQMSGLSQPFEDQNTMIVTEDDASIVAGDEGGTLPSEVANGDLQPRVSELPVREDDSHVYAVASIVDTDWLLVTTVPKFVAFETANIVGLSMLSVVAFGLIMVLGITVVIGRQTAVPITRLRDKARTMEEGDLTVNLETSRIDEIGQLYEGFASMRDALREQISEAEAAREEAEAARQETQRTNEHLERKADEYSRIMRECAEGDFTQRMDPESESEAMAAIAREFNEMIAAIEETTAHVKEFASEVAAASEEVTASSEEVRNASEQVSTSIQRISDGAERQHEYVEEATSELNTLSSTTEEIASSSDEVASIAERTAKAGDRGREAANQVAQEMTVVADDTDEVVAQFERLEEEIEEIDDMITLIDEIAEQTNMLALNANIEASRSHDGDTEGFGAVAKEVKELSQETQEATDEIEQQLTRLQTEADEAADVVGRTSEQVAQSVDTVEDAVEALEEIADYAEQTNEGIQEISTATDDQAAAVNETAGVVEDVATISRQTSEETESVAASAEEQTSSLTQVSHNASRLAQQAVQLSNILDRFETEVDGDRLADELEGVDEVDGDVAVDPEDDVFEYAADDASADVDPDEQSDPAPEE